MAGFLSLPSIELAQERRRNCKPFFIAASGFITGLIYPIVAFRHRNKTILFSYLGISVIIILFREFLEPFDTANNLVVEILHRTINFFVFTKYGPACAHFIAIYYLAWVYKLEAKINVFKPFTNEQDAFPLKVRKTTGILKNIFDIDNEKAKDIYETAKPSEGGLPSIDDLNWALNWEKLEPVQFCKKDGLKIIPEKLRANLEKIPDNKKKVSSKKTKATFKQKQSSSFSESIQSIFTYGVGGLIGVFVIRVAKEILSN